MKYKQVRNQQNKDWTNELKEILDQANKSIDVKILNNQLSPSPQTSTNLRGNQIYMSALDTAHRKFSNTPRGGISVSTNSYPINANTQADNQWCKDRN